MSSRCRFEDAVAAAARSGDWSPELRAHRDGCLACAELALVAAALSADAEELASDPRPLPDPGILWMRSRLEARRRQLDRATRGILWVQRAALTVAAAIVLGFAPRLWQFLEAAVARLSAFGSVSELPRAAGSPVLVLALSLMILGVLALYELTAVRDS